MQEKIKILFVPSDRSGVGHFRSIWPAQQLKRNHSDEVEVSIDASVLTNNIEHLSSFDIIHFHRQFGPFEETEALIKELNSRGTICIMDIDDYWSPPTTHHLYSLVKSEKLDEKIENNLRASNYVTTTTDIFAEEIKKFNKNVLVIPNALNLNEKMWKGELTDAENDMTRVAWIGGSSHLNDLENIRHSMAMLSNDSSLRGKFQFVMCGFDIRGSLTEIMPNGEKRSRPIRPHETVWMQFEDIFTNKYALLNNDKEYEKWLKKIVNETYPDQYKKTYVRRWTLPLTQYGKHYDYCDVCLAPIAKEYMHRSEKGTISRRENIFNKVKSELKIIESGVKKKALIAQDYAIYQEILKDGETGLLVSDDKKGWYKAIKSVVNDRDLRDKLANNLHEFVMSRYTLDIVTKKRLELYKQIIKEKNSIITEVQV